MSESSYSQVSAQENSSQLSSAQDEENSHDISEGSISEAKSEPDIEALRKPSQVESKQKPVDAKAHLRPEEIKVGINHVSGSENIDDDEEEEVKQDIDLVGREPDTAQPVTAEPVTAGNQEDKERNERIRRNQQLLLRLMEGEGDGEPEILEDALEHQDEQRRQLQTEAPLMQEEVKVEESEDEELAEEEKDKVGSIDGTKRKILVDGKSEESSYQDFVRQKTIVKGKCHF